MNNRSIIISLFALVALLLSALAYMIGRETALSNLPGDPDALDSEAVEANRIAPTVPARAPATRPLADPVEVNGKEIPGAFRGQWGTDQANCSGADDYGPILVSSDGFSHYEVTATAGRIIKTKPRTVRIEFSSTDIGSEEEYGFLETWEYDPSGNRLIATTYDDGETVTVYRRC